MESNPSENAEPFGASSTLQNRRNQERAAATGEILVVWHHEPDQLRAYCTLDISEKGARISTSCFLSEGLTGLTLIHRPTGIRIDRPSMVAWCHPVRDAGGRLEHYEAGIRFF
ncbi:MAG: PilZ domain-containing protein [Planctomycetes bacterium]|nr:PilZ domain-containing protein [Planctomycetota bacterium]